MRDQRLGPVYRFHGHVRPTERRSTLPQAAVPDNRGDSSTAVFRLYDPVDSWGGEWGVSAREFAAALDAVPEAQTIELHVNSPGGEVFEAITIMNLLRTHRARVVATVDGLAASAASVIACAADELVMNRNTELMIHDAWGLCVGNAADMRDVADRLDHLSDNLASVYAAKAGGEVAFWRDAMLAETWYSAEEAVAAGLADRMVDDDPAEQNAFDLSVFAHAGRQDAPAPPMPTDPPTGPTPAEIRERLNSRMAADPSLRRRTA